MEEEKQGRFERLVVQFLERKRALGWSPRTLESYRYHLSKFLTYIESETEVPEVDFRDLAAVSGQVPRLDPPCQSGTFGRKVLGSEVEMLSGLPRWLG